jgi:large subunit ribosomal protein L22
MATRIKEKAAARQANADKRPRASVKNVRISPYKVRTVLDIIRGKSYREAVAILHNTQKSASAEILCLLNSAAANAENNLGMNKDDLYVATCYADQGSTLKRIRARAKGSASRILKRTSNITVILDQVNAEAKE